MSASVLNVRCSVSRSGSQTAIFCDSRSKRVDMENYQKQPCFWKFLVKFYNCYEINLNTENYREP